MKRFIIVITILTFAFSGTLVAQNSEGKADDAARISITPQVTAQEIPQGAKKMLMNKMKQICTKNGLAGDGNNPFFIMDATVDILSKELTPTAPPMHALNLSVNFFIKDAKSGAVYSESSIEIKGVGKNETKAYTQALKNINTSKGQFKAMVERGKTKIIEFYNSECDFIVSKATALHKQGNNGEAIKVLESVPSVSKECYAKCMELLAEIEPPVDQPAKTETTGETPSNSSAPTSAVAGEMEIDNNIFLVYLGSKVLGNKVLLNFEYVNRGNKDYELSDYVYDNRIVDENGVAHKTKGQIVGDYVGAKAIFTIIPGVPVKSSFEFEKVDAVKMFEYNYQDRVFRLKDVQLTGGTTNKPAALPANSSTQQSTSTSAPAMGVNSKIYVESENETRFQYKKYSPAKIKTVASDATKGEYEVMCMGDCSTDAKWSKDIITQWHQATKTNIKEGMLVMYTEYGRDINETVCFHIGKVIAVDELYKNLVTIKGWYDDISKVNPEKILIVDKSNIEQ